MIRAPGSATNRMPLSLSPSFFSNHPKKILLPNAWGFWARSKTGTRATVWEWISAVGSASIRNRKLERGGRVLHVWTLQTQIQNSLSLEKIRSALNIIS